MPPKKKPENELHVLKTVSFAPDQLAAIEKYSKDNDRTISWIVRAALADWLKKVSENRDAL